MGAHGHGAIGWWGGLSLALHAVLLAAWHASPQAGAPTSAPPLQVVLAAPARVAPADPAPAPPVAEAVADRRAPIPPPTRRSAARPSPPPAPVPAAVERRPDPLPQPAATAVAAAAAPAPRTANVHAEAAPNLTELHRLLHEAIDRHKHYPLSALRRGRAGTARVAFRLLPDGTLERLALAASSGTGALDQAAIAAVRAIEPFRVAGELLSAARDLEVDVVFRPN